MASVEVGFTEEQAAEVLSILSKITIDEPLTKAQLLNLRGAYLALKDAYEEKDYATEEAPL